MTKLENNYIFGNPDRKRSSLIIRGIGIQMHATLLVMTTKLTELCVMCSLYRQYLDRVYCLVELYGIIRLRRIAIIYLL